MTNNYIEKIIDISTGETIIRNYTSEEIAQIEAALARNKEIELLQTEASNKRAQILEKLGLTDEEAKILLG